MKNIQIIDGALNCVYDIYQITDDDYKLIFIEDGQDIEFVEDLEKRIKRKGVKDLFSRIWRSRLEKKSVNGIHGTLFFQLKYKKKYYPNKKDSDLSLSNARSFE